jgi:hypothetical protein
VAVLLVIGVASSSTAAEASLPSPSFDCEPGYLVPEGGWMPVNAPPPRWIPYRGRVIPIVAEPDGACGGIEVPPEKIAVYAHPVGADEAVAETKPVPNEEGLIVLEIHARDGWRPGITYEVKAWDLCNKREIVSRFDMLPAAAIPTDLGVLRLSEQRFGKLRLGTYTYECRPQEDCPECERPKDCPVEEVQAVFVDVELDPSPSAKPWVDVMRFFTRVDDKRWLPSDGTLPQQDRWMGQTKDRVFATCDGSQLKAGEQALARGQHTVSMSATLPNGTVIQTPPVSFVLDADCPQPAPAARKSCGACHAVGSRTGGGFEWVLAAGIVAIARRFHTARTGPNG